MTNTHRILVIAGVLIAFGLLFFVLRPVPIAVDTGLVQVRPFSVTVDEQGRTRARNPYTVAAPITGRLLRTTLDEGDRVQQGEVIARIALPPQDRRTLAVSEANVTAADARVAAALATLEQANSTVTRVARELERREELFKQGLTTEEETEFYRQLLIVEKARVASGEANLLAARADLESARSVLLGSGTNKPEGVEEVLAPTNGTIYRVLEESERVVQAGTPLFSVSNQDSMEVVVDLLTQDAVKVDAGDPVRINGWGGDYVINAVVRYIEPEAFTKFSALGVEEQRVNVIADLLDAPANLGAEYRVEVSIVIWQGDNVLTIPSSAIFQRATGWNTFVVVDGEIELRNILIGYRGREYAQVIDGIEEGERVVLFPSDLIEQGIRVSF
jgi:HlyD family secretion protein